MPPVEFYTKCILVKNQCSCYTRCLFLKVAESDISELLQRAKNKLAKFRKNAVLCAVVIDNISLSIM